MVIEPLTRMGPLPRSHAAEANDCFMVRPRANEYKGAARSFARNGGLPSVRVNGLCGAGAFSKPRRQKYEQTGR